MVPSKKHNLRVFRNNLAELFLMLKQLVYLFISLNHIYQMHFHGNENIICQTQHLPTYSVLARLAESVSNNTG